MAEFVQSLWIGASLGMLERLAITSFLCQGYMFHLYCYGTLENVPAGTILKDGNEILPESSIFCYEQGPGKGSVAAFANIFRYKLLLERGGWWVDADVVCLKPFTFPQPLVFASEQTSDGFQVTNAIMRLPAGHEVARLCLERARLRDPCTLSWGETGPRLVDQVVASCQLTSFVQDVAVFCPIPWWKWDLVLQEDPREGLSLLTRTTNALHLWHEMWRRAGIDRLEHFPQESIMAQLIAKYGLTFS